MGLFNTISEWNSQRQEKHHSKMKEKGYCPQCNGKGFHTYAGHEYAFYSSTLDCPGCEGSGTYADWNSVQ
jgi:DnaJ-class molecular chaperone